MHPARQQVYRRDHALGPCQGRGEQAAAGRRHVQPARVHPHLCATLLLPFIPESCGKIFAQIGAGADVCTWEAANTWGKLPQTVTVHKGEAIFPRIDAPKALAELEELEAAQKRALLPAVEVEPQLEEKVDFDTFCNPTSAPSRSSPASASRNPTSSCASRSTTAPAPTGRSSPASRSSTSRKPLSARRSPPSSTSRPER